MKNQISVEYLGTFGWIMLVVMVTILALAQFGVLDLSSELPEECYLGEQIDCKKQYLDENGNLVLTLESKLNKEVSIQNFQLEGYFIDVAECSNSVIQPNEEVTIICVVRDSPSGSAHVFTENRKQFELTLELKPEGLTETFEVAGSITSDVINQDISTAFSCETLTTGTWDLCEQDWHCQGTIISEEEYLGNDICCEGTCVPTPCTGSIANGNLAGECCAASRCNDNFNNPIANAECIAENSLNVCCASCRGTSSSGGGEEDPFNNG